MKTSFLILFVIIGVVMLAHAQSDVPMDAETARQDAEHRALIIEREKAIKAARMEAIRTNHDQHLSLAKTSLTQLRVEEIQSGPEDSLHGPLYLCTVAQAGKPDVAMYLARFPIGVVGPYLEKRTALHRAAVELDIKHRYASQDAATATPEDHPARQALVNSLQQRAQQAHADYDKFSKTEPVIYAWCSKYFKDGAQIAVCSTNTP